MAKTSARERQTHANRTYGTHLIVEYLTNGEHGAKSELARRLGVTPTHITHLASGQRTASEDLVSRLVENVLGKDWESFQREARDWIATDQRQKADDTSDNRSVAVRAARLLGMLDVAISSVVSEPVPMPDPSPTSWLLRIVAVDSDLRVHRPTAKASKTVRRSK